MISKAAALAYARSLLAVSKGTSAHLKHDEQVIVALMEIINVAKENCEDRD